MLLPGPEAHQLAIYIGWLLNKTRGGMIAGLLFVLPGFLSILALSYIYVIFGDVTAIEGMFFGLKCAVLAVVVQAVFRIGSRALKNNVMVAMAAAAFVAIFFLHVPFPLIILAAAIIGCFGGGQGFPLSRQTADTSRDRARYSKTGIPSSARTFPSRQAQPCLVAQNLWHSCSALAHSRRDADPGARLGQCVLEDGSVL